jgi:hypothetical protein
MRARPGVIEIPMSALRGEPPEWRALVMHPSAPGSLVIAVRDDAGEAVAVDSAVLICSASVGGSGTSLPATVSADPPQAEWGSAALATIPVGRWFYRVELTVGDLSGVGLAGLITVA